jgi:PhoPQ-activated pathogenicity-related protein
MVWAQEITTLDQYIAKPDPNYGYTHYHTANEVGYTTHLIHMTSQQWRTLEEVDRTVWEHEMNVTVPWVKHAKSPRTAILIINSGENGNPPETEPDELIGTLATALGTVVAMIDQVPNQPLHFADELGIPRKEDEILAYSMNKFLVTGDRQWPVHIAMTKAAVRAMDTIQTFLESRQQEIENFIVVGGSKRGWTTWLTAAVDPRVRAIVPASIDLLNMAPQFVHHWEAYGFYAPAVKDYDALDLPCKAITPAGQELLEIIDPYSYRDRFTMPKLILNSAGDQFFVSDSSRFYYNDLPGPKHLRYSVNTDHAQSIEVGLEALSWLDNILDSKTGPQYTWSFEDNGSIRVETITRPKKVLLWQATNPFARDFRLETLGDQWTSTELRDSGNGVYEARVESPQQGWTAFLVELTFDASALLEADQVYTTGVRITPDEMPFAGSACQAQGEPQT